MGFIGERDESKNYVVSGKVLNAIEKFMTNLSFEGRKGRPNGPSMDLSRGAFKGQTVFAVPRSEMSSEEAAYRTEETTEGYPVKMYCCDVYLNSFSGDPDFTGQPLESAAGELELDKVVSAVQMISEDKEGKPMRKYMVVGGGTGGRPAVLAKITGHTSGVYDVDLYANGKEELSTGSGTLEVLNLNIEETLTTGTWIVANPCQVTETGE